MNQEPEKGIRRLSSNFLIISGKNLIKPLDRRANCHSSLSSLDKSSKLDPKDHELPSNLDSTLKHLTFDEGVQKYSVLNKIFDSLRLIVPKNLEAKPVRNQIKIQNFEKTPKVKKAKILPSIVESSSKSVKTFVTKKSQVTLARIIKSPEQIYQQTLTLFQQSNGFEILSIKKKYKYFLGSGNNDSLISRIMQSKKGWVRVFNSQSANFIWTQVKKREIFESLPFSDRPEKTTKILNSDLKIFSECKLSEISPLIMIETSKQKVYNRLEHNSELCSKKKLFYNMKAYFSQQGIDPFTKIPLTFHVKKGSKDLNFIKFKECFFKFEQDIKAQEDSYLNNLWLVKPGELTNRGHGISICGSIQEISAIIDNPDLSKYRTYIIQKYIYRPLLYNNRKFDIRVYTMILSYNSNIQCYFYQDGYLRTSVAEFSIENIKNRFIHLTNDAVQKKSANYGKFEESNKLSYSEFQAYLNANHPNPVNFINKVLPMIKDLVKSSVQGTYMRLDPKQRLFTFEILGYDFMLDEFFTPWLIEVNTNPCLELSGNYLAELIPKMVKDGLQIALDQVFPSDPSDFQENRFVLLYSSSL